ncbi:glycosyltransferase family 2 protein [Ornithinibacillus californiensis]|uniref:glycosyltransferase family 2 protein n=1 Tax=Ornithinibacillus californiensis TaxID=161536 RepID=UPI00064DE54E|nr:glycosyltransferase [Ornithinibacillus californiensis]
MDPYISIIVPVYNTEQYLEKCLLSIINQTIKCIEIIIIDDGSTDRSGSICDDFVKRDKRIKVIHTENNGPATARNKGIALSSGQYLGFVDSDDWIEETMYADLYYTCISKNADIAVIGLREITDKGEKIRDYIPNSVDLSEILKRAYPCNKLFKKDLFINNNLLFEEGIFYEDLELIPKLFVKANKVSKVTKISYNYVKRPFSTTTTRDDKIIDNLRAYVKIKKYLIKENLYEIYSEDFEKSLSYFKKYYINILYDYSTMFLLRNMKSINLEFNKIGGLGVENFYKLLAKHIKFKIRRTFSLIRGQFSKPLFKSK